MVIAPQSLLFRAEYLPHYINYSTRAQVLKAYRQLHRDLNRLTDSLAKPHLKQRAQHSFAAYKYVTDSRRILGLLDHATQRELKWASGAAGQDPKNLDMVLDLAFTTYKVKETPLKRVLNHYPRLCDHRSLVYRLNNITTPQTRTFEAHEKMSKLSRSAKSASEPYWHLVRLLRSKGIRTGANGRKLIFEPDEVPKSLVTVFGTPVARSRQANTLRGLYSMFLRDAPRPVHPEVMEHLERTLKERNHPRKYLRRIQRSAQYHFTVDHSGQMAGLRFRPFLEAIGITPR